MGVWLRTNEKGACPTEQRLHCLLTMKAVVGADWHGYRVGHDLRG